MAMSKKRKPSIKDRLNRAYTSMKSKSSAATPKSSGGCSCGSGCGK